MILLNGTDMRSKIVQVLATKHGLSLKDVDKIVNSQFRCVSDTMKEGKFDEVRLPRFGIFKALPGRIKHVTNAKRKSSGGRS